MMGTTLEETLPTRSEQQEVAPDPGRRRVSRYIHRLPTWVPPTSLVAATAVGFVLFILSVRGIDLARMNGLGLFSVMPVGAFVGVAFISLAFMGGLTLTKSSPVLLGTSLVTLVICLDGITAFAETNPRFPTTYQIAGFVQYISSTGHTAPGLDAYFSWPGFFALIALVAGGAGTHSMLTLLKVWPTAINLVSLVMLFFLMRNLRISWRAQWLAAFFFAVGNWVGQDYFSPQSFNYVLYLVFVAVLVNWFVDSHRREPPQSPRTWELAKIYRRMFSTLESGEMPPRPASSGQKAFLLVFLIAVFTVSTISHQLTPVFMIGACAVLVLVRRCTLRGLPILLGVIFAGYVSFAAVGYWSGHLSTISSGIGNLSLNLTNSLSGRLVGSTPMHLVALRAKVEMASLIVGLAGLGLLRRWAHGIEDRVLLVLFVVPITLVGVVSYGGEIILRTYLFMLPAACVLAALFFFPDRRSARPSWRLLAILAISAVVLPVAFFLARYGNDAFEQVPSDELAASNWVYAHDGQGVRLLWLSSDPSTDVTPQMPWSYRDLTKVSYVPVLAPRNPDSVHRLVASLFRAGPGSYLIADRTQIAALQQTVSFAPDWGSRFRASMSSTANVHVAFASDNAVVYTMHWPASERRRPLNISTAAGAPDRFTWTRAGLIVFWLLLALLLAREFIRLWRPSTPVVRLLWFAAIPLGTVLLGDIALRFAVLT